MYLKTENNDLLKISYEIFEETFTPPTYLGIYSAKYRNYPLVILLFFK